MIHIVWIAEIHIWGWFPHWGTGGEPVCLCCELSFWHTADEMYAPLPPPAHWYHALVDTWSSWARLALLLLGESLATWLLDCLGSSDPSPTDKRHTGHCWLLYSEQSRCTSSLGAGITNTRKRRRSHLILWRSGWRGWSSLSQCCMKVGAEARLPYANGWMSTCSLMWEESIKTLHRSYWLRLHSVLLTLIIAEGLVRALQWICHQVGRSEHQPASRVAGRQRSVSCGSCASFRWNHCSVSLCS